MDLCHPFQCFHGLLSNQVFVSTILVVFAEYAHIVQTQSIKLLALYSICTLKKMAQSLSSQVNNAKTLMQAHHAFMSGLCIMQD